jgi:hypothetical protein
MDCREDFDDSLLDQEPLNFLAEHKRDETVAWVGGAIALPLVGVLTVIISFTLAAPPANAELKVAVSDRVVDDKATGTPRVTLDHQRNDYFLGENVLIDYRLENAGPGPLRYEKGGFFPGLRRNDGYQVTALPVDGAGKPIGPPAETFADPEESREGPLASWKLAPGEAYVQTLYLPRYVRLEKPGRYSIRIANVDRLNPKTRFSAGETVITLKEPTPTDARTIYQRMKKLPRQPVAGIGENSKVEIADFQALLAPVYVPVLREHAMEGDRDALDGLGKMCTARANAALIEAVDRAAAKDELDFALAAYHQASGLPNPRFYPGFYPAGFKADSPDCIAGRALVERVWRPEFVDPLRRLAARLARDPKPVGLAEIEEICADVGTPNDMPNVMLGYTKAIELTWTMPPETHQYPRPRGVAYGYPIAVRMLLKRGAKVPTDPKTPGETGAYLVALRWQNDFRPADWAEQLVRWLDHPIPYVRELVLEWVPEPVPPAVLDRLPRLLAGNSGDLQIAACRLAQKHPREAFRDPLLKILRQGRASKAEYLLEEYLLNAAVDAARANGITRDQLAEIWPSRIDPSDLGVAGMRRLLHTAIDYDGAEGSPGGLSPKDTAAATTRWKRFIDEHRKELREGHRFKLGDPEITPDLFPPGFDFYLQGRPWP